MTTITTRAGKGSPLTNTELDNNFTNLNTAKYESGNSVSLGSGTFSGLVTVKNPNYATGALRLSRNLDTAVYGAVAVKQSFGSIHNGAAVYPVDVVGGVDTDGTALYYQVLLDSTDKFKISPSSVVFNESGADTDFRVESDTSSHLLFADAGNNRVGVNISAPEQTFHVNSGNQTVALFEGTGSTGAYIRLRDGDTAEGQYGWVGQDANTLKFFADNSAPLLFLDTSESVFNQNGFNIDFRVESNSNTHALFVDAGANKVVFGSSGVPNINGSSPRVYDAIVDNGIAIGNGAYTHGFIGTGGTDGNVMIAANSYAGNVGSPRYVYISGGTSGGGFGEIASFNRDTGIVFNEESAPASDFRVESVSNTHMLFVDAGNNRVSIGESTNAPNATLEVKGGVTMTAGWDRTIEVAGDSASGFPVIVWNSQDAGYGGIGYDRTAATAPMKFWVDATGSDIISTGRNVFELGKHGGATVFNQDSNDIDFRVESDSNTHMLFVDAGNNRVAVGTAGTNYTGSDFAVQGRTTFNNGSTTVGQNLIVDGYSADNDDNILVIGTQRSSGGPFIGYGLGQNGTDSFWSATYDNFSGAHSVLVLNGNALEFDHDRTNTQTAVGSEVPTKNMLRINRQEAIFNDDSVDQDFRVESDAYSQALFVDAADGVINIGSGIIGRATTDNFTLNSKTQPHYGFNLDPTTGTPIGVSGYYGISLATSGAERVRVSQTGSFQSFHGNGGQFVVNEGSADSDFRVESDGNTHALFVDAGNNRIGINTSAPGAVLDVVSTDGGMQPAGIGVIRARPVYAGSRYFSAFQALGSASGSSNTGGMHIGAISDNNANIATGQYYATSGAYTPVSTSATKIGMTGESITFSSDAGLTVGTNHFPTELMRINASGVVVNEYGYDRDFRVESDNNSTMLFVDGSNNYVGIGSSVAGATSLYVHGGVTKSSANHDPRLAANITNGSHYGNQNGGSIETVYGWAGTGRSGSKLIIEYAANTWKAYAFEIQISSTRGMARIFVGGYNNSSDQNTTYIDDSSGMITSVVFSRTSTVGAGQGSKVTITMSGTDVHPMMTVKYSQSGGDGTPRADRLYVDTVY